MAYMSAREMLSGLPVKMAEGGPVTYGKYGATAQDIQNAAVRVQGQIDAGTYDPAAAYAEIMASDISVDDALDAGIDPSLIDAIFTSPADTPAYGGPAPTATMSASVQDYYNTVMADDQIDAAERLAMQKIATDQGLSFADIVAAGVDPNILYGTPAAPVPVTPVTPVAASAATPAAAAEIAAADAARLAASIAAFDNTQAAYTAPTVYQPLPDNTSVYAAGVDSLDTTFRESAPRTEVIDAYGGLVDFDYSPGANLTSATGSGYNFTPPTVTSRPRSLMGSDQLGRYTGGRSAADLRQLTTGLGNGRSYADYAGVLQNPGSYSGGLSKSQLYSRMRGLDYQLDAAAAADREASGARGGISAYLAANPDIAASYESQKDRLGAQSLEQFARNHYNTTGRAEMAANKRGLFTLVESTGGGDPIRRIDYGSGVALGAGMGGFEGEGEDYSTSNFTEAMKLGQAGRVLRPFAEGGSVKKLQGFADGGTASEDLKALDPTDSLFITEDTVEEVNPDNIQRDIPFMERDGVVRPTPMQTESKNMLETMASGFPKAVNTAANYFVRGQPGVDMSPIPMGELASDTKALGGMLYEAFKEEPVAFFAENLPVVAQIVAGRDMNEFTGLANEARAAGDSGLADMYEQIVVLSATGIIPGGAAANKAAKTTAIKAARDAAKATASDSARMLDEVEEAIDLYPQSNSQRTQLGSSTVPSYEKARKVLGEGKTLDFGAGRGEGAEKIGADTFEPYPRKGFAPTYSSVADIPDAKYKNITSLNVLNVMPRSVRDEAVNDIGRILKPGGKAVVTTRGRDVLKAKGNLGPEPMSIFTTNDTYQKGFTQPELRNYIQGQLGEGFVISNLPEKIGQAGVLIKKRPSIKAADRAMAGRKAEKIIASQPIVKASEALGQLMEQGFNKTAATQSDRTIVGGGNIGGAAFPVLSEADPNYAGKVWGVMDSGTASRLTNLTTPETAWTTMLGAATQLKTNPIVFDKLKRAFVSSMKKGNLSPELAEKININLAVTFGEGADIRDPNIWSQANTFEKRAALADVMMGQGLSPKQGGVALGGEKSGKGVIFKPSEILIKETEKALLHPIHGGDAATFAAGPRMFSLDGSADYRPDLHPGFPTLLGGKDLQVNMQATPTEVYLPDFHRQFKKDNPDRTKPGYYDLTLGKKGEGIPSQNLTDDYIRHLLREGFNEGGEVKNKKRAKT